MMILLCLTTYASKTEDEHFHYRNASYSIDSKNSNVTKHVANGLWRGSLLRKMLKSVSDVGIKTRDPPSSKAIADVSGGDPSLVKRNGMGMGVAMAVGMSGHSMVTMVQAFTTPNITAQQRSDMFIGAAYDMTATILMFTGSPPAIALGSVMMIGKTFFDAFEGEKAPPQIDPDSFFKQIVEYIQQVIPSPDQMFMEIKPYLSEMINNQIEMKFQQQYQEKLGISIKVITDTLNIFDGESNGDIILSNWQTLVTETAQQMVYAKMPINADDEITFNDEETATAVSAYPQFVSMLIMAVKEWYITAKQLDSDTSRIEDLFKQYISAFRIQYDLMINYWYTQSKAHIEQSHFEKKMSTNQCLMTLAVPNAQNVQGYVQDERAEPYYEFNADLQQEFTGLTNNTCKDPNCRYVKALTDDGKQLCTYQKSYHEDCDKPCSKTKQAFSFIMPLFGASDSKCFLNKEECKQTQTGLTPMVETCVRSTCAAQFESAKSKLLQNLEASIASARETAIRYNAMLDDADITDLSNFMDGLQNLQSMAMQKFVPKDEVFNGDVCHGLLAVPKTKGIPKMCIVTKKSKFACPTLKDGQKQYILYPDVIRSKLPELCPNYLRPRRDVTDKGTLEGVLGSKVTDAEFLKIKAAKQAQLDVNNPDGKTGSETEEKSTKEGENTEGEEDSS
eukprot:NODE_11_length_46995_cov_0.451872.p6 type:complete len:675 gc:universal NODE_11_length_46995_cov_0.451872:16316-14292(-)